MYTSEMDSIDYKCIFDDFVSYYQKVCVAYISSHRNSFSGDYFEKWYWATGNPILGETRQRLKVFALDDRVKGFSDLYCQYIEAAQKQEDEELLLENLFAVPEQMRREFSMFDLKNI